MENDLDEEEQEEVEEGTLNLKRRVIVKQYAPQTFKKIRSLNNIKDEHLLESLDPSKNIK